MQIGVIGTCEKSCPIFLREEITKAFDILVKENIHKFSFVLLSTCRRVELYFYAEDLTKAHVEIIQALRKILKNPFEHVLFSLFETECFFHLMKVTSGLDSSITGESEIQKQVKISYEKASVNRKLPLEMHFAFQKSLKVGKDMRSSFEFFKRQNSLAHIILAQLGMFSEKEFRKQHILFIGNSEINRRLLPVFFAKSFQNITLCTHSVDAVSIKKQSNFSVKSYDILSKVNQFDAVVCATKATKYLIDKKHGLSRSQVLFDLSIPRNIDPEIKNLATLLNIEEIGSMYEKRKKFLKKEISECENILYRQMERYEKIYKDKQKKKLIYTGKSLQEATV